jgi:beta-fructofuranosidase
MPSVPEFLLRKLYIPGSLKTRTDGFEFQLNNTLIPVTMTALGASIDGNPIALTKLFLQFPGKTEIPAAFVSAISPVTLPLNTPLKLRVIRTSGLPRQLVIEAETEEVGHIKFPINTRPKRSLASFFSSPRQTLRKASLARRVARDPHHPIYHFTPPANWMNDPNGLIHWQGQTHLFYQYNPNGPLWSSIHWGHAISRDLVHWKQQPVAMAPRRGKPDADGCWSGTSVITPDGPLFFYTAVFPETVCLALPDDGLRKLHPSPRNPLIAAPPPDLKVEGFRDPCLWQEGKSWYMTIGSGIKGQGGAVLLYRSQDLIHWEYRGPLLVGDLANKKPFPTGYMWECPQVIRLGDKDLLIISAMIAPGVQYTIGYLGIYKDERFKPDSLFKLDHGGKAFYAPLTFEDAQGRRVMFGWLPEDREDAALLQAGWAGALSLPRILSLSPDGDLLMEPAPELEMLKKRELFTYSGKFSKTPMLLSGESPIRNAYFAVKLESQKNGSVEFCLAASPAAPERTMITLDFKRKLLVVDTTASSLDPRAEGAVKECPLPAGDNIELEVFLDGSILELFANKQVTLTTRLYPTQMDDLHLNGSASAPGIAMVDFQMWEMGAYLIH